MTHLLQGLLATFVAIGSGILALVGFASRRHTARTLGVWRVSETVDEVAQIDRKGRS